MLYHGSGAPPGARDVVDAKRRSWTEGCDEGEHVIGGDRRLIEGSPHSH